MCNLYSYSSYDTNMYEVRAFFDTTSRIFKATERTFERMFARTPNYSVKRVIFHPMYDHNRFEYDIAVVELNSPIDNAITPIALPSAGGKSHFHKFKLR